MAKAWSEYNSLQKYVEEQKKKKEAEEKAKAILKGETDEENNTSSNNNSTQTETDNNTQTIVPTDKENNFTYPDDIDIDFSSNNPIGELEKIEEYYQKKKEEQSSLNSLDLTKLEMPTQTKEDVENTVKAQLDSKYEKLKQSELEQYEREQQAKEEEKRVASDYAKQAEDKVNAIYDASVVSAENQALKRGLARSSIIIGQLDGIEKSRASELSSVATDLANELSGIDRELVSLNTKKENALDVLDLDYASELQTQIASELEKLEEKKKEVIEFNNKVEQLQKEYATERQDEQFDQKLDLAEFEEKYGKELDLTEQTEQDEVKYKFMIDYLNKLPREQALRMLTTDNMFAYYLGDNYSKVYYLQYMRPIN